ncbi:hypothetical protein [Fimbriimonas ginsengisoli]|nr:hypothetical protein [Fimbriimonas ginsengisoli]
MKVLAGFALLLVTACGWSQQVRLQGVLDLLPSGRGAAAAKVPGLQERIKALKEAGRQRIASGKASTKFKPSEAGVRNAVAGIAFTDPDDPKTLPAQIQSIRTSVKQFHQRMKAVGLQPNDLADGFAMAHALFSQASTGKPVSRKQIKANRAAIYKLIMSNAMYQGLPDTQREAIYGREIALAMYGIGCREQAAEVEGEVARASLISRAQRNANASGLIPVLTGAVRM